ncbi:unnamed protein product, partial [Meganyctiphanes norvegica]
TEQDSLLAFPTESLKKWREEVRAIHPGFGFMVWAGARKRAHEGWVWSDYTKITDGAWAAGEPGPTYNITLNGSSIEEVNSTGECGAIYNTGEVYDWGCDFKRAALCQIPKSSCDHKVCGKGAVCVPLGVESKKGRSGAIEDSCCQCPVGTTGNAEEGGECIGFNTCDKVSCGAFTAECLDMNDGSYICKCLPGYKWENNRHCKFTPNPGDIVAYVVTAAGTLCVFYMAIKIIILKFQPVPLS